MRAGLRQPGMRVAPLRADLGLPPERPSDDGAGFAGALGGLALQADGKIVAAGTGHDFLGFALARYETDGSLDTTFGGDGRVVTHFVCCDAIARGVAIHADGKIIAAGDQGDSHSFAVARYLGG
jgi:uncharacterized delta-60 repeat protein